MEPAIKATFIASPRGLHVNSKTSRLEVQSGRPLE